MKGLKLYIETYKSEIEGFRQWLISLGYSTSSSYNKPHLLQEFLHYLEQHKIESIYQIKETHIMNYISYLQHRKNMRRTGGLSTSQINGHIGVLYQFNEYLLHTQHYQLPLYIKYLSQDKDRSYTILTRAEIKALLQSCEPSPIGQRDRAMLSVYYGCGLRKSEGIQLDLCDILIDRKMLVVRKSKTNYQRLVPITQVHLETIVEYIENDRKILLPSSSQEQALFISEKGHRITKDSIYLRLKRLAIQAGIEKEIGLHTLRHSIATHLLENGMSLENIKTFLGHRSLDSTQLYTHIIASKND